MRSGKGPPRTVLMLWMRYRSSAASRWRELADRRVEALDVADLEQHAALGRAARSSCSASTIVAAIGFSTSTGDAAGDGAIATSEVERRGDRDDDAHRSRLGRSSGSVASNARSSGPAMVRA